MNKLYLCKADFNKKLCYLIIFLKKQLEIMTKNLSDSTLSYYLSSVNDITEIGSAVSMIMQRFWLRVSPYQ